MRRAVYECERQRQPLAEKKDGRRGESCLLVNCRATGKWRASESGGNGSVNGSRKRGSNSARGTDRDKRGVQGRAFTSPSRARGAGRQAGELARSFSKEHARGVWGWKKQPMRRGKRLNPFGGLTLERGRFVRSWVCAARGRFELGWDFQKKISILLKKRRIYIRREKTAPSFLRQVRG